MPNSDKPMSKQRAPAGVVTAKPILLDLPLEQRQRLDRYAAKEQRSTASFARLLVLRGLAAYEQSPATLTQARSAGAMSGRPVGLRLLPEELSAVEAGAQQEQRAVAAFARLLTLAGLAEYEQARPAAARKRC